MDYFMYRTLITLLVLFVPYLLLQAQSIFSAAENGIGLRQYTTSVRGAGLGGTGLALTDSASLNAYNIASWRKINNTKINLSLRYHQSTTEIAVKNQSQSFSSSTANFNGLQLGIPIQKKKWIFGISVSPYAVTKFSYILKYQTGDINYEENVFYEGNIARSQINLIWSPNARWGIAASLNYFFGAIEDRYYILFNDNPQLSDDYYKIEYRFRGPGIGASFDFNPVDPWVLGAFIDFKPRINYSRISVSPINLEEQTYQDKTTFPVFAGLGSSYRFLTTWTFSADVVYQDWSEGLQLDQEVQNLQEYGQIGIGLEHSHSREKTRKFLKKFDSRIGFSYSKTGYIFNSRSINEYMLHAGFGFPFFQGQARLDLAFIAGIRGNKDETIVEEKFIKTLISVSAGELWFQKER
ncbi:MAG: hypothetical protein A2Y94_01950 [Caldithrix sp. RBG_13_44_9]|nr:MAG: hypothetical protein A2Y94_01950 [Caldithrix sp. RBG_13_44_9]